METGDATPQQVAQAAEILTARFDEVLPATNTTVSPTVTSNTITFTFRGGPPNTDVLRPLALTQGELYIAPADEMDKPWVSDVDVVNVRMFRTDHGSFLSVELNQEAGNRLLDATSKNRGRILVTTWDRQTILSVPIQEPFGQSFQFSAPSLEQGHIMLNVLRSGRLPVAVKSFEYRDAAPKR